jgi:hypothetical protein
MGESGKQGRKWKKIMKKKNQNIELAKDDEILREEGMADGPINAAGIELRPITALSISWMQRNEVFSDTKDLIWKTCAFAFLHSAPFTEIRAVVNDRAAFIDAVDCWIEKNVAHHLETGEIATAMNAAFQRYSASASEVLGAKGSASGN